jgi:hypothetical protein
MLLEFIFLAFLRRQSV